MNPTRLSCLVLALALGLVPSEAHAQNRPTPKRLIVRRVTSGEALPDLVKLRCTLHESGRLRGQVFMDPDRKGYFHRGQKLDVAVNLAGNPLPLAAFSDALAGRAFWLPVHWSAGKEPELLLGRHSELEWSGLLEIPDERHLLLVDSQGQVTGAATNADRGTRIWMGTLTLRKFELRGTTKHWTLNAARSLLSASEEKKTLRLLLDDAGRKCLIRRALISLVLDSTVELVLPKDLRESARPWVESAPGGTAATVRDLLKNARYGVLHGAARVAIACCRRAPDPFLPLLVTHIGDRRKIGVHCTKDGMLSLGQYIERWADGRVADEGLRELLADAPRSEEARKKALAYVAGSVWTWKGEFARLVRTGK